MTRIPSFRLTTLSLALLSLVLVGFGILNYQQRSQYQNPDDGVSWIDSSQGVTAWIVVRGGPADRAGIREGDQLKAINGQPITAAVEAVQQIYKLGVWSLANYSLARNGEPFDTSLVFDAQGIDGSVRNYLAMVGLLYLLIGTFILFRRWTARKSLHFYVFCLASFVLYTFTYTGKLNAFDWTIYGLNVAAWVLQPALFLHFCLTFPERSKILREHRYLAPLLYLPGAILGTIHALVAVNVLVLPLPLLQARWVLDRAELFYLGAYFLAGALALHYAYVRASDPVLKHQLKWVTRGTWVAIVPFAALYALPYFLGFVPNAWMNASALFLAVLPITFGYAIVRYRLMDVDIIFRRGISYTLATAGIVGLYFGLIALFADFFRATFPPINSRGAWVVAIVLTAVLFQPVVNYIQQWVDRFFNRERYDYRRTLLEFARDLTSELHVDSLLEQICDRLSETLGVDRLAVLLAAEPIGFSLVRSRGMNFTGKIDTSFLDPAQPALAKGYLFFDSVKRAYGFPPAAQKSIEQLRLHYYLPFKVKERTLGYLGLGKTREGDYLSSEDIDLLQTIAGYVSIALENARLYESLELRAHDYQALRDFSQNIIESINAGVLACNLEGVIEAWNSALERLYGLSRSEAMGKPLEAIFPPELRAELTRVSDPHHTLNLYKFRLRNAEDRPLILNLSVVPLIGKGDQVIGRLLIFTDLTERVNLEDQLMQAEKLSSIGLLAAGVAHEVNTPLAVITSNAQMLMRQLDPDDPRTKTLDKIIAQAFRASEIANNLLKFSRVGGSECTDLDVNRVISESLSLVEPMLKAARISVNSQLKASLPAVYGNIGKLQQVFMNLIMNARDAMPRGGELTITTEAENSTVHVEVSDNGVGIPAEHLNKIFDPFFTTKATSRGTGLGLAVTYGIIQEHSGSIQVDSVVGRGTTFRLEFPAVRKTVNVS
ncbi:MAG TPA: ATP-binding protein [Terriglobia bacterium]|nr:ATP-binding protein [Terriglobia bacterium]